VVEADLLKLEGLVAKPDGSEILRDGSAGNTDHAEKIGLTLAERLLDRGARDLLNV